MSSATSALRTVSSPRLGVRWPWLALGIACVAVLAVDTAIAMRAPFAPFDLELERSVQTIRSGALISLFWAVDWLEGPREVVAGIAVIALIFMVRRRCWPLALVAAGSTIPYHVLEAAIGRPRPSASLVHVLRHTAGTSFPSGHIVFLAWVSLLLLLCLGLGRWNRAALGLGAAAALLVLVVACLGRIYIGEHWPSDVIGGLALGLGWTSLALSIRRLSDPLFESQGSR